MANVLTVLRILCGLLILICPAFSKWYYFFYLFGGFTDAIDGAVARKLGKVTDFGAKLDTAADFVFASAVIIKIAGAISVPIWLLLWIGTIIIIKVLNVILGAIKYHKFVAVHSKMNKVCGIAVFVSLLLPRWDCAWQGKAAVLVCMMATAAAIHEGYLICSGKAA